MLLVMKWPPSRTRDLNLEDDLPALLKEDEHADLISGVGARLLPPLRYLDLSNWLLTVISSLVSLSYKI
jgi:hypothetical protein